MKLWKTLSKETILDHGKFLRVENHQVELPDGKLISQWGWVVTPDFVNIVAVTTDEKFLCFRQTKYAIRDLTLAPVGGYMENGEIPLNAAKRELLEETGYTSESWISLGSFPVDGNRGAGIANLYLALNAVKSSEICKDDLEEQELLFLSYKEILAAMTKGEFKVLSWITVVALALREYETLKNIKN